MAQWPGPRESRQRAYKADFLGSSPGPPVSITAEATTQCRPGASLEASGGRGTAPRSLRHRCAAPRLCRAERPTACASPRGATERAPVGAAAVLAPEVVRRRAPRAVCAESTSIRACRGGPTAPLADAEEGARPDTPLGVIAVAPRKRVPRRRDPRGASPAPHIAARPRRARRGGPAAAEE